MKNEVSYHDLMADENDIWRDVETKAMQVSYTMKLWCCKHQGHELLESLPEGTIIAGEITGGERLSFNIMYGQELFGDMSTWLKENEKDIISASIENICNGHIIFSYRKESKHPSN